MDQPTIRKGAEIALSTMMFCAYHNDKLKAGELRASILNLFGPEIDAELQRDFANVAPFG